MMIKTFAAAVHGIDAATISVETDVARVGGGTYPQPDEILLVHNGVLFLG
ncbi:ATP-binding protein [uncultured Sunxiuqinia sp.]|tara:strand:- start:135178 stop:135327 length:150 start_codon:yes stop_codon:yes gene_type:complete